MRAGKTAVLDFTVAGRNQIEQLSLAARRAVRAGEWPMVRRSARRILQLDGNSAEGHFLHGQACKATGASEAAEKSFHRALRIDSGRYDAAVELADLYVRQYRHGDAVALLRSHRDSVRNSPVYLEMAASAFSRIDLHEEALPLYRRACELQPEIERFHTARATCCANLGEVDEAIAVYDRLVQRHPNHQRFHHEIAQLRTARDFTHVSEMQAVLESTSLPPEKNIFLYYALGKELEDLEAWDDAFAYYEKAGTAVKSVANYDLGVDIELIDALIATCSAAWLQETVPGASKGDARTPIFIVGLPRSGTTLVERILANHSQVESAGETFFLPIALCRESGSATATQPSADKIRALGSADMGRLATRYLQLVNYKLGDKPHFIEKLPENFLYLGFVARAFPDAKIVHLNRHPLDVCFAMYKQPYFRFAYSIDDVGGFYLAYHRLMRHWRSLLGDRIIDVQYEDLVADSERQIHRLLEHLGLQFEATCLSPEENAASSRTASRIQVRQAIHQRSVGRWKQFERHLADLRQRFLDEGLEFESS